MNCWFKNLILFDFHVEGIPTDSETAGRCLIEGWDILNASDLRYTAQPLFVDEQLAVEWGVDPLLPLQPPDDGQRTDLVYVDVWEREVDITEDEDLVNPVIGVSVHCQTLPIISKNPSANSWRVTGQGDISYSKLMFPGARSQMG